MFDFGYFELPKIFDAESPISLSAHRTPHANPSKSAFFTLVGLGFRGSGARGIFVITGSGDSSVPWLFLKGAAVFSSEVTGRSFLFPFTSAESAVLFFQDSAFTLSFADFTSEIFARTAVRRREKILCPSSSAFFENAYSFHERTSAYFFSSASSSEREALAISANSARSYLDRKPQISLMVRA